MQSGCFLIETAALFYGTHTYVKPTCKRPFYDRSSNGLPALFHNKQPSP